MKEIWKDITGYEGLYQVSNMGEVRSLTHVDSIGRTRYGRILKPSFDGKGNYLHVNLCGKTIDIHRLVAKEFVDNPNDYLEVNHLDENKINNRFDNLEWCTRKYNNTYGSRFESKKGEKNTQAKLTENEVSEIRRLYKPHSKDNNAKSLAKRFGVSHHYIYHLVKNDRWEWLL